MSASSKKEKLTGAILLRLSLDQEARLKVRAAAAGHRVGDYLRLIATAETVPTRINNKTGERSIALRLAQMDARLADLAGAAQTRLTEASADRFLAHLAAMQVELRALAAARRKVD